MTKHADRIWRTVVFAGAMLGAPLVSAEPPPSKDAKPAPKPAPKPEPPKPPDTVDSVTKELTAVDKKIAVTLEAITGAQTDADRQSAKAKLEQHRKTKAELEKRLADLKRGGGKPPPPSPPSTPLGKLEKELADNQAKVNTAVDAVVAAQNDADRQSAKAKLTALQKERAEIEKKITAEKQKLARPRTPESDKPIGRGFILS